MSLRRAVAGFVVATLVAASGASEAQEPDPAPEPPLPEPEPHDQPAAGGGWGYSRDEGFHLKSEDGAYKLRLALQMGLKFEPTWRDGEFDLGSTFAFVRPILEGNFYKPWLGYRVSMELSQASPFLLDAHVSLTPWEEFGLVVGQQGTPVSRHNSFGPQQIFFPDFATVASYFWSGRERGATVFGSLGEGRLDYYAGLYGGTPLGEPVNISSNYLVEGRITASPFGPVNGSEMPFTPEKKPLPARASFTVQGYTGKLRTTPENFNPSNNILTPTDTSPLTHQTNTAAADIWLQAGPVIAFGEAYFRTQRDESQPRFSSYGVWGQLIVNAYENVIGAGARVSWINPSSHLAHDESLSLEGQLAWFIHAPELVLKLRYARVDQQSPDPATLGAFKLPYVAGISHLVTTQLTLGF